MYHAAVGRFLSRDPLAGSSQQGSYDYVANNPINDVDPTGMYPAGGYGITHYTDSAGRHHESLDSWRTERVGSLPPTNEKEYLERTRNYFQEKPNWSKGTGDLIYHYQAIEIKGASSAGKCCPQDIYKGLVNFQHFANEEAHATVLNSNGRQIVVFNAHGFLGNLQEHGYNGFAPVETFSDNQKLQVTAVTLGPHMIVGVRKWRVFQEGGSIYVATEAWEQRSDVINDAAMTAAGKDMMLRIWVNYLSNIGAAVTNECGASFRYLEKGTGKYGEREIINPANTPNPFKGDVPSPP